MSLDSKIMEEKIQKQKQKQNQKIIKTLDDIDSLMILMKKNKIDYAEVDGFKFTKSQHDFETVKLETNENDFWKNPLAN